MSEVNIDTPGARFPFDPARPIIRAPGKTNGKKLHFGYGPCNTLGCDCNRYVGDTNFCQRETCRHSFSDHT